MANFIPNLLPEEQQEIARLKTLPGETIGTGLLEDRQFILQKEGKEGLEKLDSELIKLGCTPFNEIKHGKWYPVSCNLISYVMAKNIFNWSDADFKEMGKYVPKISLLMRTMIKHFVSQEKIFEAAPYYWKKFYTVGDLDATERNEEGKYCFLNLKNFPGHQVFCRHMEGVFEQVASFAGLKGVKCSEVKCRLKNEGDGHLFKLTWE